MSQTSISAKAAKSKCSHSRSAGVHCDVWAQAGQAVICMQIPKMDTQVDLLKANLAGIVT